MGGIIGSIFGASSSSKASDKAAQATLDAQAKNQAFATDTYNKNTALFTPQTTYGDAADKMVAGLLGTGGDPAASADAFNSFKDSTGFQTNLQTGENAILANNAARGTFQSGATGKALENYGIQANQGTLQQFLANLTNEGAVGSNAKSAITGAGNTLTTNIVSGNNTSAQAVGQNAINQANIKNNLYNNIGNSLMSSFAGGF